MIYLFLFYMCVCLFPHAVLPPSVSPHFLLTPMLSCPPSVSPRHPPPQCLPLAPDPHVILPSLVYFRMICCLLCPEGSLPLSTVNSWESEQALGSQHSTMLEAHFEIYIQHVCC